MDGSKTTACNCALRSDGGLSVVGACGCPIHGMKALRKLLQDWVDWTMEGEHTFPATTYFGAKEALALPSRDA